MHPRRRGALALLAATTLAAGPARALAPHRPLASYTVRAWGEAAGLPQATVRAIAQTPDGYLWVGTDGGLARFDGVKFTGLDPDTAPGVASAEIRALLVDRRGDLWAGLRDGPGLVRYGAGRFESFRDRTRLPVGPTVISLLEDREGRLWAGGWRGLARGDGDTFSALTPADGLPAGDVWALAEDPGGAIWIGAGDGLARTQADAALERRPLPALSAPTIRAIVADGPGALWIGTDSGLVRLEAGRAQVLGTAHGLPHEAVQALLRDRAGTLWVGTARGLARARDGRFEALTRAQGLPDDAVHALFEDREGNLWLGTRNAGLVQLADAAFTRLGAPEGLPSERALTVRETADGSLWVGTMGEGLLRIREGRIEHIRAADGLCTEWITALAEDPAGGLWIGGVGNPGANLCRLFRGRFQPYGREAGLPDGQIVRGLHFDRAGTLWIGSEGLYRLEGDRVVAEPPGPQAYANVFAVHEDRASRLWVSSGIGLRYREAGQWIPVRRPGGAPRWPVHAFLEDPDGTLWLATAGGIARWRAGVLEPLGRRQGLPEGPVFGLLDDGRGALWLSGPRGIHRVRRDELGGAGRAAPSTFGLEDGLRTTRCEGGYGGPAAWKDARGRLWFPTSRGLVWVDPAALPAPGPPPPVVVERLLVDGEPHPLAPGPPAPPGRGTVQIEYTALALRAPERVRFRYRLEPFDPDWVEAGARRAAYYTNLPPGRYTFHVSAARADGPFGAAAATLSFALAPHLHQTIWFRALGAAALLLAALALYRLRVRQLKARHAAVLAERTRIARDMHDTLAQGFTGISLELEAATRRLPAAPGEAQRNLDKARVLVRMSLADARRAVWDLRTQALDEQDLPAAIASLAHRLGGGTPVTVEASGTVRALPDELERALVRIAQEAMTNAQKHARATRVRVTVTYGPDAVELAVADDGAGFDAAADRARAGHFGLLGMEERIRDLGGRLEIRSRPGEGTTVIARLPLGR